jgi:hypothetical protein
MRKLELHSIAEDILEAPALAWSSLAWYWGLSFLGMGPRYMEYMQSGEWEIDKAFLDESNDEINSIAGYEKTYTIKERFDRAVNFYEYCCVAGKSSSINPPWDYPPDVDTLIALRNRLEAQSQTPDKIITATNESIIDDPYKAIWEAGGQLKRDERAREYAMQVKESMNYIQGEVAPRMLLTMDQLDKDSGFLKQGFVRNSSITTDDMDDVMPQEKQWDKLGCSYIQTTPKGKTLITEGIIGRYYKAGHNLEIAMWNDERKRELSGIHHATVHTWNQLMEIGETYK